MKCKECNATSNIVMSGVDAFIMGVGVGSICYTCANGGYEYAEEVM